MNGSFSNDRRGPMDLGEEWKNPKKGEREREEK